ncbi:MAG: peptidoglycan-binding protein [Streptomyces sp.]|nr:peptidoglycan-binding protein [Streptomyces sp.]
MNLRAKTASVLGAAAVATASLVAMPGTAHAAYPKCDGAKNITTTDGTFRQPYYTGTGSRNCVMGSGYESGGVARLQIVLNNCYARNLVVDGVYGPKTIEAVRYVQQYEGIDVDGAYGPVTRVAMKWQRTTDGYCIRLAV